MTLSFLDFISSIWIFNIISKTISEIHKHLFVTKYDWKQKLHGSVHVRARPARITRRAGASPLMELPFFRNFRKIWKFRPRFQLLKTTWHLRTFPRHYHFSISLALSKSSIDYLKQSCHAKPQSRLNSRTSPLVDAKRVSVVVAGSLSGSGAPGPLCQSAQNWRCGLVGPVLLGHDLLLHRLGDCIRSCAHTCCSEKICSEPRDSAWIHSVTHRSLV